MWAFVSVWYKSKVGSYIAENPGVQTEIGRPWEQRRASPGDRGDAAPSSDIWTVTTPHLGAADNSVFPTLAFQYDDRISPALDLYIRSQLRCERQHPTGSTSRRHGSTGKCETHDCTRYLLITHFAQ